MAKRKKSKTRSGDGSIQERGDAFRLRYRVKGKRFETTFRGTKDEAQEKLRELLTSGDKGTHIEPSKLTVGEWVDQWLEAGAPGRKRNKVSERTLQRYGELLRTHIKPKLGDRPLQKLAATEIEKLYAGLELEGKIAPRTAHHVHVVFGASLKTAERKGLIAINPMNRVTQVPSVQEQIADDDEMSELEDDDIGEGLSETELAALVAGFKPSSLYSIVALAATSGARRNELLALRWGDLDTEKKTLRIEWALEQTKKFGIRRKRPKTKRGWRTIGMDGATVTMLLAEKARHQRLQAGIPDGVDVDLGLIRLPAGALMFPAVPGKGDEFSFTKPRNPRNFSKEFARRAALLGFGKTRFHDLRGIHGTALLDAGIPVHIVAHRIGDDPALLLRVYTKRKRTEKADTALSDAITAHAAGFLKP
jgi:integrase